MRHPRQQRRVARKRWGNARSRVVETSAALQRSKDVLGANRRLMASVNEWDEARGLLDVSVVGAGWLGRHGHKRRLAKDEVLLVSVAQAVAQRKRSAGGVRITSANLPAHDWLKDAWR